MPQVIEVVERYVIPDFPQIDLPAEDGAPLESNWHRAQINLLIDIVRQRWQDRRDFFAGGNMPIYYTPDYFCYDPGSRQLWGWHLTDRGYFLLEADTSGRVWSAELEAWIGPWEGMLQGEHAVWLRLFDADGWLWPTEAEAERQRAEAAESEIARLQAELHRLQTPRNGDAV